MSRRLRGDADRSCILSARTYDKVQSYIQIDSIRNTHIMTLRQFEVFLAVARANAGSSSVNPAIMWAMLIAAVGVAAVTLIRLRRSI